MKKRLLALLTALLFVGLPVAADALSTDDAKFIAERLGFDTNEFNLAVWVSHNPVEYNGFFSTGGGWECQLAGTDEQAKQACQPWVVVIAGKAVPDSIVIGVLLHELAHYAQIIHERQPVRFPWIEFDADRRAIEYGCRLGMDITDAQHLKWVWVQVYSDYRGDPEHGSIWERGAYAAGGAVPCMFATQAP
jgi:hypothetical protein